MTSVVVIRTQGDKRRKVKLENVDFCPRLRVKVKPVIFPYPVIPR